MLFPTVSMYNYLLEDVSRTLQRAQSAGWHTQRVPQLLRGVCEKSVLFMCTTLQTGFSQPVEAFDRHLKEEIANSSFLLMKFP